MHLGATLIAGIFLILPAFASYPHGVGADHGNWQQRNYNTIASIYNTTIFPNNQGFIHQGIAAVPPKLFSQNVTGRITPIGNFSGLEDSVEYFFGLTPPVQAPTYATWTRAKIVSFTSGCPEVATSIVWGETTGVMPNVTKTYGKKIATIKQVAFWRFADDGSVVAYDAYLPNLSLYTQLLYGTPVTPLYKDTLVKSICAKADVLCTGANAQWNGTEACIKDLTAREFGSWDEVWGDNVICRSVHVLLAGLRPEHHCPHVGPTGGGKCVDIDYNGAYFTDAELWGAPPGDTFICPGIQQG